MAKDFRTDQIRFSKLIASGNISGASANLGVMIYRSSKASNFDGGQTVNSSNIATTAGVGNDVWMLVDGTADLSPSARGFTDASTVLFLGNVAVSGTLRAQRSTVEVSNTVPSGRFIATRDMAVGDSKAIGNIAIGNPPGVGLVIDNANRVFAFDVISGSSSGSNRTSKAALSFPEYNTSTQGSIHPDVNFHVGGRIGSRATRIRGTALFDGDLVVSGNLKTHGSFSFTPLFDVDVVLDRVTAPALNHPPRLQYKNAGTELGSIGMHDADMTLAVTGTTSAVYVEVNATNIGGNRKKYVFDGGNLGFEHNAQISFTSASGGGIYPALSWGSITSKTVAMALNDGDFSFSNFGSSAENTKVLSSVPINFKAYSNARSPGQAKGLRFEGPVTPQVLGSINSLSYQRVSVSGSNESALVLKSTDSPIRVQTDNGKLYLSASGGVEITSNLNVLGAIVSIESYNATVKDSVILLASGAVSSNQNGGIAIASGSSVSNQALVFGRVANDTWGVGRKDVDQGRAVDLSDMNLVNFRTATTEYGAATSRILATSNVLQFSSSAGFSFQASAARPIFLSEDGHLHRTRIIPASDGVQLKKDSGSAVLRLWKVQGNEFGPYLHFASGSDDGDNQYIGLSEQHNRTKKQLEMINQDGTVVISSNDSHGCSVSTSAFNTLTNDRLRGHYFILSASSDSEADTGNATTLTEPITMAILGGYSNDDKASHTWINTAALQKDTAFFVSGAIGCVNKNLHPDRDIRGAAVFGGDLVVSGNFYPGGGVLKVQAVRVNPLDHAPAPGYLRFGTDAGGDEASFEIARDSGHLKFKDTASPAAGTGYTLTQLAALAVTDNTDVFAVTDQNGSSPFLSYVATTGSFSFDHNPRTNGYTARRTNQIGDDVYFFVSGSVNNSGLDWDGAWRGTSVFAGDVVTSGSLITNTIKLEVDGAGAKVSQRAGAGNIKFFVDKAGAGTQVEVMRLTNGGANLQLGADSNSDGKLAFALEANAYVQFINGGGSPNTLKIVTDENADDKIQLTTGTGDTAAAGGTIEVRGDVVPTANNQFNLGSSANRWANVYTGDLHLRNDRGDWTIVEESDFLCVVNNLTGKKYKMMLEPIGDNE